MKPEGIEPNFDRLEELCETLLSLPTDDMSISLESHKLARINESDIAVDGIFYYVYLKPNWQIVSFSMTKEDAIIHPDLWQRAVVPLLVKHYKIKKDFANNTEFKFAFSAMPRGRVMGYPDGSWIVDYGPLPKTLPENRVRVEVVNRFGLTRSKLEGKVKFVTNDQHYVPDPQHVSLVEQVIGVSW